MVTNIIDLSELGNSNKVFRLCLVSGYKSKTSFKSKRGKLWNEEQAKK